MPLGSFSLTYHFADQLCKHQPKSVLDLGVGFGLQGALVRQYLDGGVQPWKCELYGVEAFDAYHNPVWGLYNSVHITTIQEFVAKWYNRAVLSCDIGFHHGERKGFDFIIFTDVIEHLEKEEGRAIVNSLIGMLNKGGVLMIGTPGVFCEQDAVHGNEYEIHRSVWAWNEFPPGFEVIKNGEPDEFGHRMILVKYVRR